jgi:hypothetical protein
MVNVGLPESTITEAIELNDVGVRIRNAALRGVGDMLRGLAEEISQ